MNRISVFPLKSTYISSNYSNKIFFNSNELKITKYYNDKNYTLLNFPLNVCNTDYCMKWHLYVPLYNINTCYYNNALTLSIIYSDIDYRTIKYYHLTNLCIINYCNFLIDQNNIYEKYVLIDVSSLVYHCTKIGKSSFNIMLGALSNNFNLYFNKNNINENPRLIVDDKSCSDLCNKQVAIELNLSQVSGSSTLYDNDVVIFNNIVTKTPYGIEYNIETGAILILKKGYYIFQWNFSIEGTTYIESKCIGLRNNNTGIIYPYPVPKSIQGQISGMALVDANEENQSFSLINLSKGDLLLSSLTPCASVTVIRI